VVHPAPPGSQGVSPAVQTSVPYQVTFFEGNQQIGAGQVNADGTVTITTNSLTPGHHLLTARYDGDPNFSSSQSNTVDVLVGTVDGPTVTRVARYGYHWHPTKLVVTFSAGLDPIRAQHRSNFRLIRRGRDGKFGTRDDIV